MRYSPQQTQDEGDSSCQLHHTAENSGGCRRAAVKRDGPGYTACYGIRCSNCIIVTSIH